MILLEILKIILTPKVTLSNEMSHQILLTIVNHENQVNRVILESLEMGSEMTENHLNLHKIHSDKNENEILKNDHEKNDKNQVKRPTSIEIAIRTLTRQLNKKVLKRPTKE